MSDETTSAPTAVTPSGSVREPKHLQRMLVIWLVLAIIGDVLFWTLVGPHVPPGVMTSAASDNQFDFNILFMAALPVIIAVWVFLAYSLIVWRGGREGSPEPVGGPASSSNRMAQVAWITTTTFIVLALFVFGTVELMTKQGSGGGEGPNPVWSPTSKNVLPIQVIAQQWKFTYRYPTYGGFETSQLIIPNNTSIAFHVTSLDVIHDFWAYQLSIKADANPQQDNVAFTTTNHTGSFVVRCAELCGIWHGAMYNSGKVVSKTAFVNWAKATEAKNAENTALLPTFAWTYVPDANGADGGYYPDNVDPYSPVEIYGAQKPVS